jgi:hypothetical protein
MSTNGKKISSRIAELEAELEKEFLAQLAEKQKQFHYGVKKGRVAFDCEMCAIHTKLRKHWIRFLWDAPRFSLIIAPVIYSLALPLLLLDAWLWVYQGLCFPVYGIAKAERSRYIVLDRGHLDYLNWIERFNCDYCSYANGLIAFAREVSSRTEQYFCPIKHASRCAGPHLRYHDFADYGDAVGYRAKWKKLRDELRSEK